MRSTTGWDSLVRERAVVRGMGWELAAAVKKREAKATAATTATNVVNSSEMRIALLKKVNFGVVALDDESVDRGRSAVLEFGWSSSWCCVVGKIDEEWWGSDPIFAAIRTFQWRERVWSESD